MQERGFGDRSAGRRVPKRRSEPSKPNSNRSSIKQFDPPFAPGRVSGPGVDGTRSLRHRLLPSSPKVGKGARSER